MTALGKPFGDKARAALESFHDQLFAQPRHGGLTLPQVDRIKARVNDRLTMEFKNAKHLNLKSHKDAIWYRAV